MTSMRSRMVRSARCRKAWKAATSRIVFSLSNALNLASNREDRHREGARASFRTRLRLRPRRRLRGYRPDRPRGTPALLSRSSRRDERALCPSRRSRLAAHRAPRARGRRTTRPRARRGRFASRPPRRHPRTSDAFPHRWLQAEPGRRPSAASRFRPARLRRHAHPSLYPRCPPLPRRGGSGFTAPPFTQPAAAPADGTAVTSPGPRHQRASRFAHCPQTALGREPHA